MTGPQTALLLLGLLLGAFAAGGAVAAATEDERPCLRVLDDALEANGYPPRGDDLPARFEAFCHFGPTRPEITVIR